MEIKHIEGNLKWTYIFINDDISPKARIGQRKIIERFKNEKYKNKYVKIKVGFRKIKIDDKIWVWSAEENWLFKKKDITSGEIQNQ